ncbi:ZINC FINGER RING/FYVE/PHD-TYPE [Salix purpurea]|uniref:RING-type E3 ubiquitin transferase n=1 Tax=Salix purpurea TaxID=77065 RepID=A0A9Q0Z252_SALPP|nr:ZINC FINGER RING/FYVE/PHD-TYPE [Salix purpurea]
MSSTLLSLISVFRSLEEIRSWIMVSLCCCLHNDDPGENVNSSHRGFMHTLIVKYAAVFSNEETPAFPEHNRGAPTPSMESNAAVFNITHSETSIIPPRILPFEAKPGPANTAGQSHQDTEQSSARHPVSVSKEKAELGSRYIHASIDEEDICPTCLEEYSVENPRIVTRCNHHYHLSCIYEWMERSQTCPVCSKVMIFEETS